MKILNIITVFLLIIGLSQAATAEETLQNERFKALEGSIVVDSQTGLMWASQDNGEEMDWYDAENYCREFSAGGFTDWRLPSIKELATLYTKDRKNAEGYYITDPITITDCCMWSSDTNMGGAAIFSYKTGKEPASHLADKYQLRALPVRGVLKEESHKEKKTEM